jgi:hypothetical protein
MPPRQQRAWTATPAKGTRPECVLYPLTDVVRALKQERPALSSVDEVFATSEYLCNV